MQKALVVVYRRLFALIVAKVGHMMRSAAEWVAEAGVPMMSSLRRFAVVAAALLLAGCATLSAQQRQAASDQFVRDQLSQKGL